MRSLVWDSYIYSSGALNEKHIHTLNPSTIIFPNQRWVLFEVICRYQKAARTCLHLGLDLCTWNQYHRTFSTHHDSPRWQIHHFRNRRGKPAHCQLCLLGADCLSGGAGCANRWAVGCDGKWSSLITPVDRTYNSDMP